MVLIMEQILFWEQLLMKSIALDART